MGKAHSNAWRQVGHFFDLPFDIHLHTICGRNKEATDKAKEKLGWSHSVYDWHEVVNNLEIDVIDINTPNHTHAEIAIASAKAGKAILCEKPLAKNLAEAKSMLKAVEDTGVINMICHNYRRVPAVSLAKKLISEGILGNRVYHFHARYAQDWLCDDQFPMTWRLDKDTAGSGAHGDIHAHIIDLGHFLLGDFDEIVASFETFTKQRPKADNPSQLEHVTVDDAAQMIGRFKSGAMANLEATRFAQGRKNNIVFEINGEKASLRFNFEDMNRLELFEADAPKSNQGFKSIIATESSHPYSGRYWPPGHVLGYEHTFINTIADFVSAIESKQNPSPSFADGLKVQAVLEAAEKSWKERAWIKI